MGVAYGRDKRLGQVTEGGRGRGGCSLSCQSMCAFEKSERSE